MSIDKNGNYIGLPARAERSDPFDNYKVDLSELETASRATAERNRLSNEILSETDKKLEAFKNIQQSALIQVAKSEGVNGATDEEIIRKVNHLQVGNEAERLQYIEINKKMIKQAAVELESKGLTGKTLGEIFKQKMSAAGTTLAGIPQDLTNLNTTQVLTIAAAAGIPYLLGGGKWWIGGMTTLAVAMQSPNAARAVTATGGAVLRGSGAIINGHIATAWRGLDVINSVGTGVPMDQVLYSHGLGIIEDFKAVPGYALDKNYNPEAANANPALQEYYHLGEDFAPSVFKPLLGHLQKMRELEPPTLKTLPTRQQLTLAGVYLKQAEGVVSASDYEAIRKKRIEGKTITPRDKQNYLLYKYCDLIKTFYLGPKALQPQGAIVKKAYEGTHGTADIDNLIPLSDDLVNKNWLDIPEDQRHSMLERTQTMLGKMNFEELTQYGFVGLGAGAVLLMMLAGMTIGVVKKALGGKESKEEKVAKKFRTGDEESLNRSWWNFGGKLAKKNRYKVISKSIDGNASSNAKDVYDNLVSFGVLFPNDELKKALEKNSLALDIKNNPVFSDFITSVTPPTATPRKDVRKLFLDALKKQTKVAEVSALIDNIRGQNDLHAEVRKFYKFARQRIGESTTFKLNMKDGSAPVSFTIKGENDFNERLHTLIGFGTARGVRDFVPDVKGTGYAFRYVSGGPPVSARNESVKAVKLVIMPDGKVMAKYRKDPKVNLDVRSWNWTDLGEVTSIGENK